MSGGWLRDWRLRTTNRMSSPPRRKQLLRRFAKASPPTTCAQATPSDSAPGYPFGIRRRSAPFSKLLRRIQPDVVNAHNIHSFLSYHTLKMARDAGCGVVFSAHDAMTFAYGKLPSSVWAARRIPVFLTDRHLLGCHEATICARIASAIIPFRNRVHQTLPGARHTHIRTAPSQALADAFAANDMPPVSVVHNGIDENEWQSVDESIVDDLQRRLDLKGKRVILIAGRLSAEKGLRQMLLALNDRLRERLPQAASCWS